MKGPGPFALSHFLALGKVLQVPKGGSVFLLMKDRRLATSRPTMTMAERLRRGMTGEMASDLQSLLTKSKPIIIASDTIIKPSVDLTQVLLNFLHDRITGAS